ncbi:hypothetical protein ETAA8_00080 [Anatilimnocola aggregata]|uniref:Uncharacterized protein n=1 Tax=Anatilimnocola aggregata TaxID=2528021 RepID=A0A517Y407_9BACT|nr:hypothetical protein [Anatilimnocola aggregata]QDU24947.1 hypothetical protein ETAA8_00080 [Anatilimnocola aggregata]
MQLVVTADGDLRFIYAETVDLRSLGPTVIRRGSYVEPDTAGNWLVDLGPVDGPRLGPFVKRSEALEAEVAWLQEYWLIRSEPSK